MKDGKVKGFFERKTVWAAIYALYLSLVLLSVQGFLAEESVDVIRSNMDEQYQYHLSFDSDGASTHYDVTRHDTGEPGIIDLTYTTTPNMLEITNIQNIKTLKIDVDSMFQDEANKVFKKLPSEIVGMDMDYWLEAGDGIFIVEFNIPGTEPLESLTFTKFPVPKSVLVNNNDVTDQEWWGGASYTISGEEITISNIPAGQTTTVTLYFKQETVNQLPTAAFTMTPSDYADVSEDVSFDGSSSFDPDGSISVWIWDFGDASAGGSGQTTTHAYDTPGTYTVRLTVRDDASPHGEHYVEKSITVAYGALQDTDSDGLRDLWEWDNFQTLDQEPGDDYDSDGYADGLEFLADSDPTDSTNYKEDSDSDNLGDKWEWSYFGDLDEGANGDPDGDDFTNDEEETENTDPTDELSVPTVEGEGKKEKSEPSGMNMMYIIVAVVIVIVMIPIILMVMRSKKVEKVDQKRIDEMETKIEQARKMGLPTGELERLLTEAKGEDVDKKKRPTREAEGWEEVESPAEEEYEEVYEADYAEEYEE